MRFTTPVCAAFLALIATTSSAEAGLVTFDFTGRVTQAGTPFGVSGIVGAPVQGSFTFDTLAVESPLHNYLHNPPREYSFVIGGTKIEATSYNVFVFDNLPGTGDFVSFRAIDPIIVGGTPFSSSLAMHLDFTDPTNSAFNSNALPLPFNFGAYATGSGVLAQGLQVIRFSVDTVTPRAEPAQAVPEPSSVILLALGMIGLVAWRRNRHA